MTPTHARTHVDVDVDINAEIAATVQELLMLTSKGVPALRTVRQRLSARLRSAPGHAVVAVGLGIASSASMRPVRARWIGWELIARHPAAHRRLDIQQVEALGMGNASWDEVDTFGIYIAGPCWMRGQINDQDIQRWAASDDHWQRRTALVACVCQNTRAHGGRGNAAATLMIATLLLDDRHDMVVKAMSWALRSLIHWDREAVAQFVKMHDSRLAARAKRETTIELRAGTRSAKRSASLT